MYNTSSNKKVGCELCGWAANLYCKSDGASLCWGCDYKVHGANFLVANHTRCVLCHNCQATTPWTASGPQLPHSTSLCLSCRRQVSVQSSSVNNHHHDEIEERGSQVVPPMTMTMTMTNSSLAALSSDDDIAEEEEDDNSHMLMMLPPPPPSSSSSSSSSSLKRKREGHPSKFQLAS